jgi:hypothetical protein
LQKLPADKVHNVPPVSWGDSITNTPLSASPERSDPFTKSNRQAARQGGIFPAIPYRSNPKDMPAFFPKILYKVRAFIEQASEAKSKKK